MKTVKIYLVRTAMLLLINLAFSCSKTVVDESLTPVSHPKKLSKLAGRCDIYCVGIPDAQACDNECMKKFMEDYGESEIRWTSCSDDFGIPIQGCNGSVSFVSKVKFCWGYSPLPGQCYVYMEIDNLPSGKDTNGNPTPCLLCLSGAGQGHICIKMKVHCDVDENGVGTVTLTEEDPDLNGDTDIGNFTVTVTGDPKITFCCVERIGGGGTINRCCTGDIY